MVEMFKKLDLSGKDRVFIVGDIHGCYSELEMLMDLNSFNYENDFLLSVGDLVDRGPESERCLEFIDQPWFQHVSGNHERMVAENIMTLNDFMVINGGGWLSDLTPAEKWHFSQKLNNAPILLEVLTPKGDRIGLSHASLPFNDWEVNIDAAQDTQGNFEKYFLWDRHHLYDVMKGINREPYTYGIDRVYHGHNALIRPYQRGNIHWIDTGGGSQGGKLTLINVDDHGDVFK